MAAYELPGVHGRLTTPLLCVDDVLRPTTWETGETSRPTGQAGRPESTDDPSPAR